jgi:hypothetical protein
MNAGPRNNAAKTRAAMPVGRPFKPGNPGRPKGSRNKLGEAFLDALHADWQEHGADAIARVRQDRPQDYLKVVASTLPKDLHVRDARASDVREMSDEDLAAIVLNGQDEREAVGREL